MARIGEKSMLVSRCVKRELYIIRLSVSGIFCYENSVNTKVFGRIYLSNNIFSYVFKQKLKETPVTSLLNPLFQI